MRSAPAPAHRPFVPSNPSSPHHGTPSPLGAPASPPLIERNPVYSDLKDQLTAELAEIEQSGTYKHERVITSPQAGRITAGPVGREGSEVLNFCANNYLGLRSEEHTSELQSRGHLVCRLLLEKK